MIRLSLAQSASRQCRHRSSCRSSAACSSRQVAWSSATRRSSTNAAAAATAAPLESRVQPLLRKHQRAPASSAAHQHRVHRPPPPLSGSPSNKGATMRAEETQEILQKFFRHRHVNNNSNIPRNQESSASARAGPTTTTSAHENSLRTRPSADVSNQYFSKLRPFFAQSDSATPSSTHLSAPASLARPPPPPPPSLSSSKLSHVLNSSFSNHRVHDGPRSPHPSSSTNQSTPPRGWESSSTVLNGDEFAKVQPREGNAVLRRPPNASAPVATATATKSDPTNVSALRAALFGDRKQSPVTSTPSSRRGNGDPAPNARAGSPVAGSAATMAPLRRPTTASAAPTTKTRSTTTDDKIKDFDASLSEFIRRVQADQAKRAAAEQAIRESAAAASTVLKTPNLTTTSTNGLNSNPSSAPQLPLWRTSVGRTNMDLRSHRNQQRREREAMDRSAALAWVQQPSSTTTAATTTTSNNRKRPAFVDPKKQVVVLPPYPVSLVEASLLLRERMTRVRRLLRDVLGYQRASSLLNGQGGGGAGGIMIEPDVMELLALELDRPFEKFEASSPKAVDEPLLVRRAEAAAAVSADVDPKLDEAWASLPSRPPVVCLLGHVDHGKTTLMDTLRRKSKQILKGASTSKSKSSGKSKVVDSSVAGTEAGGITQMISAFQVPLASLDSSPEDDSQQNRTSAVTFLDTPGHAAFKAMRQSGSDAADIIVLVVAADDGVSAQTVEILNFYKSIVKGAGSGGISLVVAMNKIDKPGVDVDESRRRIESQLLEHGILVEGMPYGYESEFGPPVQLIPVSGLTGEGIDDLIEGLMLQAEVMDLRADESASAEGIVMDARVDKGLGNVVDCIIRWGSLSKGDVVVSGTSKGCIRFLKDMNDKTCAKGLPSQPVRIIGFDTLPKAGEALICLESEEAADELISRRMASLANDQSDASSAGDAELQSAGKHMMNDAWKDKLEVKHGLDAEEDTDCIRIPVIVKADADGSLAAIREALLEIGQQSRHNVMVELVKSGVGPLLATEIQLAKETGATVVCFNVKNEQAISRMAEDDGVAVVGSKVIYTLLDQAKEEFANYMPAEEIEVVHGRAEVQATYDIGGMSDKVAGLKVADGKLYRSKTESKVECQFRVLRGGKLISQTDLRATSLKHFKDDVNDIGRGKECGLSLGGFNDYQAGDVVECYSIEYKKEFA